MHNSIVNRAAAIMLCLGLSGCATIFNGSRDQISISAPPDAEIRVNGAYVGKGAATTTIPKKGPVSITAVKKGCSPHTVNVRRQFDPVTLLGLFIDGGLITILIIDGAATGAWSGDTDELPAQPQLRRSIPASRVNSRAGTLHAGRQLSIATV